MNRIIMLGIVVVLVIAGWTGAWLYASSEIKKNIVSLADADGQSTPKLTCDRLDIGGYPFWFDAVCDGATLVSGDLTAKLPEIKATTPSYWPTQFIAVAKAPLTLEDAFTGSKQKLDWQKVEASAHFEGWRIGRISIVADAPAFSDTLAGDTLIAKASHAEFHLLDIPGQHDAAKGLAALALYAKADDLDAPGFSIADGKATLEADISGLSDDIRTYGDADLVKRWQAAGGQIKLVGFKGADGADNFAVTGHLSLDSAARPQGQLAIASKGLVERFGGLVPEQVRGLVLGAPAADGTYHQTLNLTNGLILSGIVPLGTLPSLY